VNAKYVRKSLLVLLSACLLAAGPAFANATITIVNGNAPNEGFNDPTPVAPVGGNPGTTLGQQRLNAFQYAANIWGSTLDSNVPISILATFEPLSCTATGATLGSAGTIFIFANFPPLTPFPGPEFSDTWYGQALANKRAGNQLNPDPVCIGGANAGAPCSANSDCPGSFCTNADIRARFNSRIGDTLPTPCLVGTTWYYGLDPNQAANQINLVTVLLHEFAHGLNFQQFANVSTGSQISGLTDIYGRHIHDNSTGKFWNEMTNGERVASAINSRKVVFNGANVTAAVPGVLEFGVPLMRVNTPSGIAGAYDVGLASFGSALTAGGVTGNVVQALDPADGAGPTAFDACSPLTNAAAVAGNIALVDRGTCGFIVKVKNAQNAGAIAVIVADNAVGSPPAGLGGADPTITIPSVRITQSNGNLLKANLAGLNASLLLDMTLRAGADPASGRALLYTPNPVVPGSTISHWDTIAFPNQLMEPAINADLTHSVEPPQDLTLPLMRDIGWFPDADVDGVPDDTDCEPNSDLSPTVVVGGCNSGVPNTFFTSGCTISDQIQKCALGARNHGGFVSCVAHLTNDLKKAGIISGAQKGAIQSCAARASIP